MYLFYSPDITNKVVSLSETESQHARKSLRMEVGHKVQITNGKGRIYRARIIVVQKKYIQVELESEINTYKPRNYNLHIAIAPTKNINRFEWFVEKSIEIGVDTITPLLCERSERKHINIDRTEKIMIAAMKQCQHPFLPDLSPITSFEGFINNNQDQQENIFIAHCMEGQKQLLKNRCQAYSHATILIGPEGDFSERELSAAIQSGFEPISLGPNRLRTETAAVIACSTVNFINQ